LELTELLELSFLETYKYFERVYHYMRNRSKKYKLFQDELLHAKNERDVERAYASECERIGYKFKSAEGQKVDGILTDLYKNNLEYAIAEFKYDANLNDKYKRSKMLLQPMIYLYRMSKNRPTIPPSCIIGDKNYCFSVDSQSLRDFLVKYSSRLPDPSDWEEGGIAPSNAYQNREDIIKLINEDPFITNSLIYNVSNQEVELKDIVDMVVEKYKSNTPTIKISKENIVSVYSTFKNSVVNLKIEKKSDESDTDLDNRLIHVFFDLLTDEENTTLNEKNNSILNNRGKILHVFGDQYHLFKKTYCENTYKTEELAVMVASKDILIEEMSRRRHGVFFTPDLWIKKAHEMISEQFGSDWKDKHVVWDCASGTNNLTRNAGKFYELYNSTLEEGDVNTVNDMKYEGNNFQFDFLNDDEEKLPNRLKKLLVEKKPLLFLINPPYGTAKNGSLKINDSKPEIAKNEINEQMRKDKIGTCRQQLYAQFLYRILIIKKEYGLNNIKICIFSPPLFMSGEGYEKFRDIFYNHFVFKDGMLFRASEFKNDISGEWGISFTTWEGKLCD